MHIMFADAVAFRFQPKAVRKSEINTDTLSGRRRFIVQFSLIAESGLFKMERSN
jgi:hypothetical protein